MNQIDDTIKAVDDALQYDPGKRRFKSLIGPVIVFTSFLLAIFLVSLFLDLPGFVILSFFSFALTLTALVHDHWILNSAVTPFVVYFPAVCVLDAIFMNWESFILHFIIVVMSLIVGNRNDTSLIVGIIATVCYSAWLYTISRWLGVVYYDAVTAFISAEWQFVISLAAGVVAVIIRAGLSWAWKEKGNKIDCEFGICPL